MTNLLLGPTHVQPSRLAAARAAATTRLLLAVCVGACTVLLASGCTESRSRGPKRTCLLVGISKDDPLWPLLKAGAEAYAATVPQLQIRAVAPEKPDPAAQAELVRKNLDRPIYAVAMQTAPSEQTTQLISQLANRGIPVVLIGQDIPESGRFGYVGRDEYEAGQALADALNLALGERATYVLLHAGRKHLTYATRLRGFTARMNRFIRPKELKSLDSKVSPALVLKIICEHSQRYPNLGAFVSLGDWPVRAGLEKLRGCLSGETTLVLPDALPEVWPLIEEGLCGAAVGTDYGRWGYEAVSLCELAFHGATQPNQRRITPPRIVRAANLSEFKQLWRAWSQGQVRPAKSASGATPSSVTLPPRR